MEKTGSLLAPLLKRLGIEEGVRLGRIRNDWQNIFDQPLSAHMSPVSVNEGELLLNIDSPIWMQQLTYYETEILEKLGIYGIKKVRFKVGKVFQTKREHPRPPKKAELSATEALFVEELIAKLDDAELKEAVRGAVVRALKASTPKPARRKKI